MNALRAKRRGQWIAGLALLGAVALPARAAFAEGGALPDTAAEHLTLAKKYSDRATEYRKEAAEHKTMAEDYKKVTAGPSKSGIPNPWAKKMEAHCGKIAKDMDALAADADKMADYHSARAKELQGK